MMKRERVTIGYDYAEPHVEVISFSGQSVICASSETGNGLGIDPFDENDL